MSSSSPTKPPSIPSRSSSQLSLDSHLSSPRKRHSKSSSIGSRRSIDHHTSHSTHSTGGSRRSSEISHAYDDQHHQAALSPHMRMGSGFAVKVGIGSPKLDFGRRDWIGGPNKEGGPSADRSPTEPPIEEHKYPAEGKGKQKEKALVDRVSGLPSPPGTESDIAPPSAESSKASSGSKSNEMTRGDKTLSSSSSTTTPKSPPRPFRRTSSTGSAQLLARKPSSRSSSTNIGDSSPRLRTTTVRPKHSPSLSMSRSASSSSSLITSPLAGAKANGSLGGSTRKSPAGMSRSSSHSSSLSLGGQPGSVSRKGNLAPLDTRRAISPGSKFSSPERTAKKLPPVTSSIGQLAERKAARRLSRDSYVETLAEEEDTIAGGMSRSRSHGSELDDKIREAEERIAENSHGRGRRSTDIENLTPVRGQIRRHDSYTRVNGSPLVASSSASIKRSATMSSASMSTHPDSPAESLSRKGNVEVLQDEGQEDREKSGGSSSSRRRKALPADFRNNGLFTPSPQKPANSHTDEPLGSARSSRLRQFIDSPIDHSNSSPLPSRFSTASRRSGEQEVIASPSRANRYVDGLERSASMVGMRGGDTSGYARRNWSQSISGLPRSGEEVDPRGLPRDRYRAESVMGGAGERSTYTYGPRASFDTGITPDRASGRRGMSTLVSERDLLAASRSRLGSIAPGDSISAVGAKSEKGDTKDPLEVIRRLEEQRTQSKKRWDHMPRPVTSMSSLRDSYNNPPDSAPIEGLRHRRSIDQDSPLSPTYRVGSRAGLRGPSTEPRPMRSSTSLGGRSSASFDFGSPSTTEHGRLLFEAFRVLESKIGPDILASHPELLRAFHSATRTSENINTILRNALHLASQIAVDAELDDPVRVREEYSNLALLLREAGKSSENNVRDMTRILLDLPKIARYQQNSGSAITSSTSGGSVLGSGSGRLRRSESASLSYAYDPAKQGVMSEDRARRWQPSSPSTAFDRSPLQGRWSIDTPRRSFDVARASTSIGDTYSPISRYSRERDPQPERTYGQEQDTGKDNRREREKSGGHGSTVSSLMSKVRAMTPRKSMPSPKLDLSTIETSPPQTQPQPKVQPSQTRAQHRSQHNESPDRMRNILKKKASSLSTNTVKGSSFMPSTSGGKATTAISQVTAGDLSPTTSGHGVVAATADGIGDIVPDEPNSPMSRFSFRSQRGLSKTASGGGGHTRNSSDETNEEAQRDRHRRDSLGDDGYEEHDDYGSQGQNQGYEEAGRSYETDAVSLLAQRLVQADKARDDGARIGNKREPSTGSIDKRGRDLSGLGIAHGHTDGDGGDDGASIKNGGIKRPSISDRFRASLRKGSRLE
ncbi:hypothetical protein IAT40_005305 [Kwoniella sp. CBS 6097]